MTRRSDSAVADAAPADKKLTDYDRAHLSIYLRLLDAAEEGASWEEVAPIVLGIDPTAQPDRARLAHASHLARARWLTAHGYRHLLRDPSAASSQVPVDQAGHSRCRHS